MSARGFLLGRVRRLGKLLASLGLGSIGAGPPPAPPIITGPCMTAQVIDVGASLAVSNAAITSALLPTITTSLLFGDALTAGIVGNAATEGTAIDVC